MPEDPLHDLHARLTAEATKDELLELLSFHVQALRELRAGLMEAKHSQGGKGPDWGRASAHQALHAVNRFLHAHDMQDVSSPLVVIQGALLDLEHGITPAMLAARADGDRVSPRSKRLRGYAAGIMGGLMKHMSRPEAAGWVSRKFSAAGQGVKPNTIISWRQEARNPKGNPELREAYRNIINLPAWANDDPRAHAERLFASLISVYPQKEG